MAAILSRTQYVNDNQSTLQAFAFNNKWFNFFPIVAVPGVCLSISLPVCLPILMMQPVISMYLQYRDWIVVEWRPDPWSKLLSKIGHTHWDFACFTELEICHARHEPCRREDLTSNLKFGMMMLSTMKQTTIENGHTQPIFQSITELCHNRCQPDMHTQC